MQTNKALRQKIAALENRIEVYRGYVDKLEDLRERINAGFAPNIDFPRLLDIILDLYRYANGPIEGGENVQEHPEGPPAGGLRQLINNIPAPPPEMVGEAPPPPQYWAQQVQMAPDPINFQFRRR